MPGLMTYVHVQVVSPNHRGRISESPVAFQFSPVVEKKSIMAAGWRGCLTLAGRRLFDPV